MEKFTSRITLQIAISNSTEYVAYVNHSDNQPVVSLFRIIFFARNLHEALAKLCSYFSLLIQLNKKMISRYFIFFNFPRLCVIYKKGEE